MNPTRHGRIIILGIYIRCARWVRAPALKPSRRKELVLLFAFLRLFALLFLWSVIILCRFDDIEIEIVLIPDARRELDTKHHRSLVVIRFVHFSIVDEPQEQFS